MPECKERGPVQSFTSGHALQKRVRRWRRVDMIIFSLAFYWHVVVVSCSTSRGHTRAPRKRCADPGWHRVPSNVTSRILPGHTLHSRTSSSATNTVKWKAAAAAALDAIPQIVFDWDRSRDDAAGSANRRFRQARNAGVEGGPG